MNGRVIGSALAAVLIAGCDAAEDVRVQPLPSLEASSPESRLGLPEIMGHWRFAGWELAPGDTGRAPGDLPAFGSILLETQRLDSIAGFYAAGEARMPLVGEVRRDSILALAGAGRYLTARISTDTLWLVLTSLLDRAAWPDDARAAFVRTQVASRFVRVRGAMPALAAADTTLADTVSGRADAPAMRGVAPPTSQRGTPGRTGPERVAPQRPEPQVEREPAEPVVEPAEPVESTPEPRQVEPEVSPARRPRPRLLGVPVDSSSYSPTASRAIDRPAEVSARR